jgi:hypothetical protein
MNVVKLSSSDRYVYYVAEVLAKLNDVVKQWLSAS